MYDLIGEYEQSLSTTREMKRKVEEKIFKLKCIVANEDLPFEERAAASDQLLLEQQDRSIISGMESDLVYAIDWMLTSRKPGTTRGIERRSYAQRTKLIDPIILQSYSGGEDNYTLEHDEYCSGQDEDEQLKKALAMLTKKQREVFLLVKGQGKNLVETAKELKISKQAAHKSLVRAERRLGEYVAKKELDKT